MSITKTRHSLLFFTTRKLYNVGYFEDCRSPRIRSLLCVNEEFEDEQDAKRATLDDFQTTSGP